MDADTETTTLQAIIEAETGLPVEQQAVFHNGKLLPSRYGDLLKAVAAFCFCLSVLTNASLCCCHHSGTLQAAQVQNNDLLMLQPRQAARPQPQQAPSLARNRDGSLQNPQGFLDACLSNPATMAQFPPAIRDAVTSGDIEALQTVLRQSQREHEQRQMEAQLIRPGEDPMDLEVQVLIGVIV